MNNNDKIFPKNPLHNIQIDILGLKWAIKELLNILLAQGSINESEVLRIRDIMQDPPPGKLRK